MIFALQNGAVGAIIKIVSKFKISLSNSYYSSRSPGPYSPTPEILKPDYRAASDNRYGSEGNLGKGYTSSGEMSGK